MSETPTTETEPVVDEKLEPTDATTEPESDETTEEPETFPRDYVEKLRKESAGYRERAKDRDDLAQRLHAALTAADGRLASPDELAFDEAHLTGRDALTAAIDDLLARKPYLAARRVVGEVGQGASPVAASVDLAGLIRRNAG